MPQGYVGADHGRSTLRGANDYISGRISSTCIFPSNRLSNTTLERLTQLKTKDFRLIQIGIVEWVAERE